MEDVLDCEDSSPGRGGAGPGTGGLDTQVAGGESKRALVDDVADACDQVMALAERASDGNDLGIEEVD
jgi:hypothetical protein